LVCFKNLGEEDSQNVFITDLTNRKFTFYNPNAKQQDQRQFEAVGIFQQGITAVMEDGRWSLIDANGKAVDIKKHEGWSSFAYCFNASGEDVLHTIGIVVEDGQIKENFSLAINEHETPNPNCYSLLVKVQGTKKIVINPAGKKVVEGKYREITICSEDRFIVMRDNDWHYLINKDGKDIIDGEQITVMGDNLLEVTIGEVKYLYNFNGEKIGEPTGYNWIGSLKNGALEVKKHSTFFYIDHKGHRFDL